jgi:hypothetical protein
MPKATSSLCEKPKKGKKSKGQTKASGHSQTSASVGNKKSKASAEDLTMSSVDTEVSWDTQPVLKNQPRSTPPGLDLSDESEKTVDASQTASTAKSPTSGTSNPAPPAAGAGNKSQTPKIVTQEPVFDSDEEGDLEITLDNLAVTQQQRDWRDKQGLFPLTAGASEMPLTSTPCSGKIDPPPAIPSTNTTEEIIELFSSDDIEGGQENKGGPALLVQQPPVDAVKNIDPVRHVKQTLPRSGGLLTPQGTQRASIISDSRPAATRNSRPLNRPTSCEQPISSTERAEYVQTRKAMRQPENKRLMRQSQAGINLADPEFKSKARKRKMRFMSRVIWLFGAAHGEPPTQPPPRTLDYVLENTEDEDNQSGPIYMKMPDGDFKDDGALVARATEFHFRQWKQLYACLVRAGLESPLDNAQVEQRIMEGVNPYPNFVVADPCEQSQATCPSCKDPVPVCTALDLAAACVDGALICYHCEQAFHAWCAPNLTGLTNAQRESLDPMSYLCGYGDFCAAYAATANVQESVQKHTELMAGQAPPHWTGATTPADIHFEAPTVAELAARNAAVSGSQDEGESETDISIPFVNEAEPCDPDSSYEYDPLVSAPNPTKFRPARPTTRTAAPGNRATQQPPLPKKSTPAPVQLDGTPQPARAALPRTLVKPAVSRDSEVTTGQSNNPPREANTGNYNLSQAEIEAVMVMRTHTRAVEKDQWDRDQSHRAMGVKALQAAAARVGQQPAQHADPAPLQRQNAYVINRPSRKPARAGESFCPQLSSTVVSGSFGGRPENRQPSPVDPVSAQLERERSNARDPHSRQVTFDLVHQNDPHNAQTVRQGDTPSVAGLTSGNAQSLEVPKEHLEDADPSSRLMQPDEWDSPDYLVTEPDSSVVPYVWYIDPTTRKRAVRRQPAACLLAEPVVVSAAVILAAFDAEHIELRRAVHAYVTRSYDVNVTAELIQTVRSGQEAPAPTRVGKSLKKPTASSTLHASAKAIVAMIEEDTSGGEIEPSPPAKRQTRSVARAEREALAKDTALAPPDPGESSGLASLASSIKEFAHAITKKKNQALRLGDTRVQLPWLILTNEPLQLISLFEIMMWYGSCTEMLNYYAPDTQKRDVRDRIILTIRDPKLHLFARGVIKKVEGSMKQVPGEDVLCSLEEVVQAIKKHKCPAALNRNTRLHHLLITFEQGEKSITEWASNIEMMLEGETAEEGEHFMRELNQETNLGQVMRLIRKDIVETIIGPHRGTQYKTFQEIVEKAKEAEQAIAMDNYLVMVQPVAKPSLQHNLHGDSRQKRPGEHHSYIIQEQLEYDNESYGYSGVAVGGHVTSGGNTLQVPAKGTSRDSSQSRNSQDSRSGSNSGSNQGCFNCGEDGHMARDCSAPKKASSADGRRCYNCNKTAGHLAVDCPEPQKPRKPKGEKGFKGKGQGGGYRLERGAQGWWPGGATARIAVC